MCIVFAKTWDEHLHQLSKLFTQIQAAGLNLNPEKCNFVLAEVPFLGHIVSGLTLIFSRRLQKFLRQQLFDKPVVSWDWPSTIEGS